MYKRPDGGLQPCLRSRISYRAVNDTKWREGETLRFGPSGILFLSEDLLELGTEVTIILAAKISDQGRDVPVQVRCKAQVTGRRLANWPEVLPAATAKIVDIEFVPESPASADVENKNPRRWFQIDMA